MVLSNDTSPSHRKEVVQYGIWHWGSFTDWDWGRNCTGLRLHTGGKCGRLVWGVGFSGRKENAGPSTGWSDIGLKLVMPIINGLSLNFSKRLDAAKGLSRRLPGKFGLKWEVSFHVVHCTGARAYYLRDPQGKLLQRPWNAFHLWPYFSG